MTADDASTTNITESEDPVDLEQEEIDRSNAWADAHLHEMVEVMPDDVDFATVMFSFFVDAIHVLTETGFSRKMLLKEVRYHSDPKNTWNWLPDEDAVEETIAADPVAAPGSPDDPDWMPFGLEELKAHEAASVYSASRMKGEVVPFGYRIKSDEWIDENGEAIEIPLEAYVVVQKAPRLVVDVDYPLSKTVRVEHHRDGGWTKLQMAEFVRAEYQRIYAEEEEGGDGSRIPGLLNRAMTNGPYGIWGHDLGDLTLEDMVRRKDGTWALRIGS